MSSQKENDVPQGSTASLHQKLNPDGRPIMPASDIEQWQQQIAAAEEKVNQYWDKLLRAQAEADNTQRRAERDVANAHKYALDKFVLELLPIIDNLERSLETANNAHAEVAPLLEGIQLTQKMFILALEKFGVEQVNPVGDIFNPELHQAVSVQSDPQANPGSVLKVLQKGYLLNGRLIRPALVIVAKEAVEN